MKKETISIGLVVSEFNAEITEKMLAAALACARREGCAVAKVVRVPGAYDTPLAAKKLLKMRGIDAVAVIGAIVTGGTKHDEFIASAMANALTSLSLEFEKPVTLGVIGPGATYAKANARAKEYAERAVMGAKKLVTGMK
ncbi:MAG: 6,7-dimethyl-8-ribityllumazine synthase [Candidatus Burarchaeum sp.]|nr:6,7-dimethyl-8-ribityllumazine synthase [Candidatus Burarchaeum sp.]MDO8340110.1 6,7-dimethyl-8-ribityllumazine synthase [Candidatus Burarchaeum sp.]